jgi:ATP/maltotriose-dependent transcriptional regulator MalT
MPNTEASLEYVIKSLAVAREAGITNQIAWQQVDIGCATLGLGCYADSADALQQGLDLLLTLGDRKARTLCQALLGLTEFYTGKFASARERCGEALCTADRFGFPEAKALALTVLALLCAVEQEMPVEAKQLSEQATNIKLHNNWLRLSARMARVVVAYALGDRQTAWEETPQRLKDSSAFLPYSITCLTVMGLLLCDDGEYARAAELLGLTLNHPASPRGWFDNWPLLTRKCKQLQDALGSEAYATAWERGKHLTLDEAINNLIGLPHPETNTRQQQAGQGLIEPLTEQELKIVQLLADGLNSREVAQRLYLGVGTIRWYLKRIYGKLDVHSRSQAIARAREMKLLA